MFQELSVTAVENVLKVFKTVLGAIQYNDKRAARLRGFCKFLAWRKIRQFQPLGELEENTTNAPISKTGFMSHPEPVLV